MGKKIIHKYHGKFLLIFIFLLTISCSVSEIKIIQSHEEKSIAYGISKQDFLASKFFNTFNGKKTYKSSLTSENLLKRLNLDSAYFYSDSKIEVLHIPVKTLGKYKRTLLSISKQKTSNTFIITYPNPDDSRLFYITDLQGKLIQKVTVDEKGIGHNEFYNNKSTTGKTSGMCTETVYVVCSSGEHSFGMDNAFACTYWQNLSAGTPPQLFTVNTQCEDYSTGGGSGGGTVDNSPPSGGGGTSISPVGGGGNPTDFTSLDCIQYLDCENCNLPGDLNNNCSVDYNEAMFNSFVNNLTSEQKQWLNNDISNNDNFFNYLSINNFNQNSLTFAQWGVNFLMLNSDVTFEQFQNWFTTPREGKDGDYDATYWENQSLTFPQQQLPTFQAFDDVYPRTSGAELAQLIGGDVLQLYNQYPSIVRGFCALKVSRGLNYSGVTIPYIVTTNGNPGKVIGSDGKYYFLNAKALNKWMQKTFGISPSNQNHIKIVGIQGGTNGENFPFLTTGIKGIYSMVSTNSEWASGHADLINNGGCTFGCHFYDTPPAPIDYIDIWILN